TVDISNETMRNVVFPPFQAAIRGGAATFMTSFNEINGVPATGNVKWLRDWLRGEQKFNGVVVSDYNSIGEMVQHGFAADRSDAARLAITAGCDIDMEANAYIQNLAALVRAKKVPESLVDEAAGYVLAMKFRLGLFADPYRNCDPAREKAVTLTPEHL